MDLAGGTELLQQQLCYYPPTPEYDAGGACCWGQLPPADACDFFSAAAATWAAAEERLLAVPDDRLLAVLQPEVQQPHNSFYPTCTQQQSEIFLIFWFILPSILTKSFNFRYNYFISLFQVFENIQSISYRLNQIKLDSHFKTKVSLSAFS
jgi:hypothetical protein